jgi:hypothetical protein
MVAVPSAPAGNDSRAELRRRIAELNRRFDEQRRSSVEAPDETATIDRMRKRIAAQRIRLERLEHEAAALLAEIARHEEEIAGREKALALLLGTVVTRWDRAHAPAWSPVPVLGYRLWAMHEGALHGARSVWRKPSFSATCAGDPTEVPHSDGKCGRLGCGVYATKEVAPLLEMHVTAESHSYVAAVVALTGKVVEHERGYRAQTADVVAVYAVWPDRVMTSSQPERIGTLFRACDRIPSDWCELRFGDLDPRPALTTYLTARAQEETTWI